MTELSLEANDARSSPRFRVITVAGKRRGIRLEEIFWETLEEMAAVGGVRLGEIIDRCAADGGNLASALRVRATGFLQRERARAQACTGRRVLASHVHACPAPAFALSAERKIIAFNQAFLSFIETRLWQMAAGTAIQNLRLSLDTPFAELAASVRSSESRPVPVGFAMSAGGRQIRGRLNAAPAPLTDQDAIIGYILPG